MNTQQASNLRTLIRYMDDLPLEFLGMHAYFHTCGTPACALGHACSIPELASQGLNRIAAQSDCDIEERMFGLNEPKASALFGPALATSDGQRLVHPTPKEWAVEARKVLAENGYSMDEPKPAQTFQSFMAKALEPVDTRGEGLTAQELVERINHAIASKP